MASVAACGEARPCGAKQANTRSIVAVAAYRRTELQDLYQKLDAQIEELDKRVATKPCSVLGQAVDEPPGSGTGHGIGHRCVFGDPARFADGKAW